MLVVIRRERRRSTLTAIGHSAVLQVPVGECCRSSIHNKMLCYDMLYFLENIRRSFQEVIKIGTPAHVRYSSMIRGFEYKWWLQKYIFKVLFSQSRRQYELFCEAISIGC